ncbi:Las1-like-domain-containing protein [Crucibulum laeve]|uniref:Las1-like-domain-containing protein n=1 Tax=Crucibulum laeve TaxID=68775 RepID=A0A5C3LUY1_9AGAR|nr:Las1-like-domain-containing protein [Crucibulum laeve]
MRLPRRVPWTALTELDQLCSWIYTDENDLDAKRLAVDRLSAWKATTTLSHALESALSLLVVTLHDHSHQGQLSSSLALRQSYATAIIRLVNGLVDPLQLGAYARSIASIANQLGLPPWLVELRHAATHEEMPSLEVLREATRQSMLWILHNYFLPTINPSVRSQSQPVPLRPLAPILRHYKSLLKAVTRDTSLRTQYKPQISTVLKDIERWIAEATVSANVSDGNIGWNSGGSIDNAPERDQDPKERWALEVLCDGLLEKGMLVPLSKKKRTVPEDSTFPPSFSVLLWTPLLQHLQMLHVDFCFFLCDSIVTSLCGSHIMSTPTEQDKPSDSSYDICLARWLIWCITTLETDSPHDSESRREDIIIHVMQILGRNVPLRQDSLPVSKTVFTLLASLCKNTAMEQAFQLLLLPPKTDFSTQSWEPSDLAVMNQRLAAMLNTQNTNLSNSSSSVATSTHQPILRALGWESLGDTLDWKPCPIGVYIGG